MKKIITYIISAVVIIFLIVVAAGIIKFNILQDDIVILPETSF